MKKLIVLILIILPLSLHAKGIQEDYNYTDELSRVSYAFGVAIGSNLLTTELEFNYYAFAQGVRAVLENTSMFTEQEALEIVDEALEKVMDKKNAVSKLEEEEFLANNKERPEISETSSGLQYEILTSAEGKKPAMDSKVRIYYDGRFIDGTQFDNTDDSKDGIEIHLNRIIPGLIEGLTLMSVGSKYRFYIPSALAYGSNGIPTMIPPYSTLIFTVELLEIISEEIKNEE